MKRTRAAVTLLFGALAVVAGNGCSRGPSTPEAAYQKLVDAVRANDAARLFDALDAETRWAWMSVQRAHREAYDVVLSNFPEPERDQVLRRYEDGAKAESAADLFAKRHGAAAIAALRPRLPDGVNFTVQGDQASTPGKDGAPLWFHRLKGWGYRGLYDEAKTLEKRAVADLEGARTSATDFERAAARSGR